MSDKKILSYVGFAIIITAVAHFIKYITENADTKLYEEKGLAELQDKERVQKLEELRKSKNKSSSLAV